MVRGQSREVTVAGWGDVYVPREVPVSAGKVRGKDDATAHSSHSSSPTRAELDPSARPPRSTVYLPSLYLLTLLDSMTTQL